MKRVVVANDHGAVELARKLCNHLEDLGYSVNWLGTKIEEAVDYADMAKLACKEFLEGNYEFGILCCGTGIGISMAANKVDGIRCALPQNIYAATMAKQHNDANFIAFGGRIEYQENPIDMLDAYINEQVSNDERHVRRRAKIMAIEKEQN